MSPYGKIHKQRRAAAIAALAARQPAACQRCGGPMWATPQDALRAGAAAWTGEVQLDHAQALALGGAADGAAALSHKTCNLRHGGQLAQALRRGHLPAKARKPRPALPPGEDPRYQARLAERRRRVWGAA